MALYPRATLADPPKPGLLRRVAAAVKAKVMLLPENATQGRITPRVVIMHSAAGKGSLYRFFLRSSNLESHFWVSETGAVEQYIDTNVRADANNKANGFAISIETESTRSATEPWNPAQLAAIVKLVRWCCDTHGIPTVKCPRWDGSGIGWHIQFGAPGPWTPVSKSCPGPARIRQMPGLIAAVATRPQPPAPPEPNAGREFRRYNKGATDARIYELGGYDNQIARLQILLGVPVTRTYGDREAKLVTDLKALAHWTNASGGPDRTPVVDERFMDALEGLAG